MDEIVMTTERDKHLPLTETAYYTLLALKEPAHGYLIMQRVKEISGGQVDMAAGTMYGVLDALQRQKLIKQIGSTDGRRKTYRLTPYGEQVLGLDVLRIKHMLNAAKGRGISHA